MKSKAELFAELDVLKARLDAHRPLPPDVVSQIREDMRVRCIPWNSRPASMRIS